MAKPDHSRSVWMTSVMLRFAARRRALTSSLHGGLGEASLTSICPFPLDDVIFPGAVLCFVFRPSAQEMQHKIS